MPVTEYPQHSKLPFCTRRSWVWFLFLNLLNNQRNVVIAQCWAWWENQAGAVVDVRTSVRVALAGRFLAEQITVGISRASCKNADDEWVKTTVLFLWAIHSVKTSWVILTVEWEKRSRRATAYIHKIMWLRVVGQGKPFCFPHPA